MRRQAKAWRFDPAPEKHIAIAVSDRGPGVPPEHISHMADRFWRAEHSRARHAGGAGLGLAIAAAICKRHGGELQCLPRAGGGMRIVARFAVKPPLGLEVGGDSAQGGF